MNNGGRQGKLVKMGVGKMEIKIRKRNSRGHGLALDTKLFTDYLKPELTSKTLAT